MSLEAVLRLSDDLRQKYEQFTEASRTVTKQRMLLEDALNIEYELGQLLQSAYAALQTEVETAKAPPAPPIPTKK